MENMENVEKLENGTTLTIYTYKCIVDLKDGQLVVDVVITPETVIKCGFALHEYKDGEKSSYWYGASDENRFRRDILEMWSRDPNRKNEFIQSCKEVLTYKLGLAKEDVRYYETVISKLEKEQD